MSRIEVKIFAGNGKREHAREVIVLCRPIEELKQRVDDFIIELSNIPPVPAPTMRDTCCPDH